MAAVEDQLADLDFKSANAILNALFQPVSSDPSSPADGQIWYRTDTDVFRGRANGVTFTFASGSGIASLVEDTSPQLGGMLDVNSQSIGDGTRELLSFVVQALAVNQVEIENAVTGNDAIIRATGDDTNVGLTFQTKGAGDFNFEGDVDVTGTVDGRDVAADGTNGDNLITLSGVAANEVDLGTFTGSTIADDQTIKQALQLLETALEAITGATNLTFSRDGVSVTVESDTGTDAALPVATTSLAGVMSAALWNKLDGIETGADVTDPTNVDAAGATMNSDTDLSGTSWMLDDDTMAADDATKTVSQQSLVAYVASQISGIATPSVNDYDAATNSPDLDSTPIAGIVERDQYVVTVAGNFFTEAVEVGDLLIAKQDDPTALAHWIVVNRNLDAATETVAGIVERATQAEVDAGTDTTRYVSPATLAASTSQKFVTDCAATAITTCTHNFGTLDVSVEVYDTATGRTVKAGVQRTGVNAVDVEINPTPSAGDYRIIIRS